MTPSVVQMVEAELWQAIVHSRANAARRMLPRLLKRPRVTGRGPVFTARHTSHAAMRPGQNHVRRSGHDTQLPLTPTIHSYGLKRRRYNATHPKNPNRDEQTLPTPRGVAAPLPGFNFPPLGPPGLFS